MAQNKFDISVFFPIKNDYVLVEIYTIGSDMPLDWIKANADKMAKVITERNDYTALMVQQLNG